MTDPNQIREDLEAQAQAILEKSLQPQSTEEMEHAVAEQFRRLGVPAIKARLDDGVFDITVTVPKGEG